MGTRVELDAKKLESCIQGYEHISFRTNPFLSAGLILS